MSAQEPRSTSPSLTSLPTIEQLARKGDGFDADAVSEAFEAFRRHASQLQAQLRVLQAAGRTSSVEPTGHAVRMDALHLIRSAAEFADVVERDAQTASAAQLARTEEEVTRRQREIQQRESDVERYRVESERQRAELLNAATKEAREIVAKANADTTREIRETETRAARLLEQARHQATELTNSTRAEVEQTLEWARGQATAVMARAQQGVEQLLRAAGHGEEAIAEAAASIVRATGAESQPAKAAAPTAPKRPQAAPEPSPTSADEATEPEPPKKS